MANEQNLVRGEDAHKLTAEEASKGGKRSGEVRREKKDLRKALEMLLEREFTDKSGNTISGTEAITTKLFEQAMKGNIKAFETIRATVGQDPVQKIMVAEVEQSVIEEVEAMVNGVQPNRPATTPQTFFTDKIQKVDMETGEIVAAYKTVAEAARQNAIDRSNLAKAIKAGKPMAGFLWFKRG